MLRVLVVEASEADARAIVGALRGAGYVVDDLHVSSAEALEQVRCQHWDFLTCDWDAPGFAGRAVIDVVRKDGRLIPFIVVSRNATEDNVVDAMRMGAHDFIHKDRLGRLPLAIKRELAKADRSPSELAEQATIADARFESLWSSDFMMIGITGTNSRIIDANPGFVRVLGYSRDELRELTWEQITTPESNIVDRAARERLFATGHSQPWEKEVFAKDGRRVPLLASVVIMPGPRQAMVMAIDLSERNRLTADLYERIQIAEGTTEVAVEATAMSDIDAFLQRCTTTLLRTFGAVTCRLWTLDPVLQTMNLRAHAGLLRENMETTVQNFDMTDRSSDWPTETMRPPDRPWAQEHDLAGFAICRLTVGGILLGVMSLWAKRPFSDAQKEGLSMLSDAIALGVLRANAEATKDSLEAQLRQAQKLEAIGSLAGGVAHDFNNMLSVIIGYADFIREGLPADHELVADVGEITTAAIRAQKLTSQLLAFSRGQVLQPRVLDLDLVIGDLSTMLRRLLTEDIELVVERGVDLAKISADPNQIEQVLMNLVVNARDAIPGAGTVTIKTENVTLDDAFVATHIGTTPGPQVKLSVRDTGAGMTSDVRARVFEPFFTTKPQGKGTGLGLSTVFGIVKQSGGALWVDSEVGAGTTFEIYFPLSTLDEVVVARPRREPNTFRGGETILLCEDEPQVRTICREILVRAGFRVLDAVTGDEAIAIAAAHRKIDLLVTDVVMPQMSGRQLAEKLVAAHPNVRVLYMSGYTDDAIVRTGVSQEGVFFIQKPLHPDELVHKVRDVLDSP